jgi:enterochelin esterase-like enzyme
MLRLLYVICALAPLVVGDHATAQDTLSGRYTGTLGAATATGSADSLMLILDEQRGRVRGSIGPNSNAQRRFDGGKLETDTLSFTVGEGEQAMRVTLAVRGTELVGTVQRGNESRPIALMRASDLTFADRSDLTPLLSYENGDVRSPRLLAIRMAVESGDERALERFWSTVASEGTPLVESMTGDDSSVLATFLWRGNAETQSVLLERGRFTFQQPVHTHLLSRLPGTDLWFKTLRLPRAARFSYTFSENDPLAALPPGSGPRVNRFDPLNPRLFVEGVPEERRRSLAELPGAPRQPWLVARPGTAPMTRDVHRVASEHLGGERDVFVYTPPGYRKDGRAYPVLYLSDADDPGGPIFSTTTVENLLRDERIRPLVVVRVGNAPGARTRDLSCNPAFSRFLQEELRAFVLERYNVSDEPAENAVGGQSLGGLSAACAALHHPEAFGRLLIQSGSFWWQPTAAFGAEPNWVARELARRPKLPLEIFLEAGVFEVDLQGRGGNVLETTRHLRDVLVAKGYRLHYQEFAGDHEYVNWRGSFADGLIALFTP